MDALARLERLPLGRPHYRLLLLLGFGWALDAMDVGLISFTLPALSRDFGLDPVGAGLLGSVGLLGMLFGALLGGRLADRFGRKAVVGYSLFLAGLGSLLTALAPSLSWVFLFRFLTGLGLGAELPVAASLMGSSVPRPTGGGWWSSSGLLGRGVAPRRPRGLPPGPLLGLAGGLPRRGPSRPLRRLPEALPPRVPPLARGPGPGGGGGGPGGLMGKGLSRAPSRASP